MPTKPNALTAMFATSTIALTLSLGGCERDYEPYIYPEPSQNTYRAVVGAACSANDSCRVGLVCDVGTCQHPSCEQAPDPSMWCEQRFGADSSWCLGGQCTSGRSPVGAPCRQEVRCVEGAACINGTCTPSCVERADCPPSTGCVNDASGAYCGAITGCQGMPARWCEALINLDAATAVSCINDTCVVVPLEELECAQDEDCPSAHHCLDQRCAKSCTLETDCGDELYCFFPVGSNARGVCRVE